MPLTGKQLLNKAKKAGWKEVRQNGSHHIVEKYGETVSIPVHNKVLGKGIEQTLLKVLGLK